MPRWIAIDAGVCLRWRLATVVALGISGKLNLQGLIWGPALLAIAQGLAFRRYWHYGL